ncbi:DUF835 domain-containing protein [Thermococcus sp.]
MISIDYREVKLLAEIAAFSAVTFAVYSVYILGPHIEEYTSRRLWFGIRLSLFIFWTGYLINVLNDVIVTPLMKVLDDVFIALGAFLGAIYLWTTAKILSKALPTPKKLSGTPSVTINGVFLVPPKYEELKSLLKGFKVLAVTRTPSHYAEAGIPYIWITPVGSGENTIDPRALAPLLQKLVDSVEPGTVVILDGIEYLIIENGFNSVFRFLTNLKDRLLLKGVSLLVVVDPMTFDEKQLSILEREIPWLQPFEKGGRNYETSR